MYMTDEDFNREIYEVEAEDVSVEFSYDVAVFDFRGNREDYKLNLNSIILKGNDENDPYPVFGSWWFNPPKCKAIILANLPSLLGSYLHTKSEMEESFGIIIARGKKAVKYLVRVACMDDDKKGCYLQIHRQEKYRPHMKGNMK